MECAFGILNKRRRILDYGIRFCDMEFVEKVFTVCYMLHNGMLTEMESTDCSIRVGRGAPLPGDGIWLQGDDRVFDNDREDNALTLLRTRRREMLAEHIHYCAKMAKQYRSSP